MSVVALKPTGTQRPLFCVHGIGGEVDSLSGLVECIPPDLPFYGLEVRKRDGNPAPYESVPEMAAHYVACIRQIQPRGPYALAGYSFGGSVAFEMAAQLAKAKERVDPLVIIDHVPPPTRYEKFPLTVPNLVRILANLGRWVKTTIFARTADMSLADAAGRAYRQLRRTLARRAVANHSTDSDYVFSPSVSPVLGSTIEAHTRAIRAYKPAFYHGEVTLIRASTLPLFRPYPRCLGWSELAATVRIATIPGNHTSILKGDLAKQLAGHIHRAALRATQHRAANGFSPAITSLRG